MTALTILMIDDDSGDRAMCKKALKQAFGGSLIFMEAADGETGLAMLATSLPDCVMLDHSMPGGDGIEVLKRIREDHPYLPVVMLDGKGNDVVAVKSMKDGAQDYIAKSVITPHILQRVVEMAIRNAATFKHEREQRASMEIFTRALAHDLKEPVRTIRSFIDMMSGVETLDNRSQRAFGFIQSASERMERLIDSVFFYTQLDMPSKLPKENCNAGSIIGEVRDNIAALIHERGANITFDGEAPNIYAHLVQMRQLFQNLIVNAIKHCDTPVAVHISAVKQDGRWLFRVQDNGPGIEDKYLQAIFNPFRRITYRKEDGQGLGMGLAICRKIVDLHGGSITCESEPGKGAAFIFSLPIASDEMSADKANKTNESSPALLPAGANWTPGRILLVDDSEMDLMLHKIYIKEKGQLNCDLLTANNGKAALAMLSKAAQEQNPIDLMLLDINMPGMGGFELLEQLQKEQGMMPKLVVMCTTSAYEEDKKRAEDFHVMGYLSKPLDFDKLRNIIERSGRLRLEHQGSALALLRAA